MNQIEFFLAIFGAVMTVILGYLGLRYTLKYRNKTEIVYLSDSILPLYKSIVKNIDNIEILFHGKKIEQNLFIISGTFFNTGNNDIDKSHVHKPLEIAFPSNVRLVQSKIVNNSEGLKLKTNIEGTKLIFEWALLKQGEFFSFACVIEYINQSTSIRDIDITRELEKKIKVNHRIVNLSKVHRDFAPNPPDLATLILISLFSFGALFGLTWFTLSKFYYPDYDILTEVVFPKTNQFVTFKADSPNTVSIINNEGKKISSINKQELERITGVKMQIIEVKLNYWRFIVIENFGIIWCIGLISLNIRIIHDIIRHKKLRRLDKQYNNQFIFNSNA